MSNPYIRKISITAPTTRWEIVDRPSFEVRKDDTGKPIIYLNRDDARQALGQALAKKLLQETTVGQP